MFIVFAVKVEKWSFVQQKKQQQKQEQPANLAVPKKIYQHKRKMYSARMFRSNPHFYFFCDIFFRC